jgi:hypothetical protein
MAITQRIIIPSCPNNYTKNKLIFRKILKKSQILKRKLILITLFNKKR